ncbi:uncharacterized protein LOC117171084 [Belonocnema kinseyi]|uniref:uncharacterized protein LOC117171084 n=1 Tax=Belonocnema kinseyi TaxID=2817044 RepID=UPI00143D1583|nr:uncharacterized protein LOC117171084 [Belonocnema kinseyi]
MKTLFANFIFVCISSSIFVNGETPVFFLDTDFEELIEICKWKKLDIRDNKIYDPYFNRYLEIQEILTKKLNSDKSLKLDKLIQDECIKQPTLKQEIENMTNIFQSCLEDSERLDETRKKRMVEKVLETKCGSIKKALIVRAEENCIQSDNPDHRANCIHLVSHPVQSFLPVPMNYSAEECREFRDKLLWKNSMATCKEETSSPLYRRSRK